MGFFGKKLSYQSSGVMTSHTTLSFLNIVIFPRGDIKREPGRTVE